MAQSLYGETFAPGALLGAFVVDEVHSAGGFATVYRASHADTGEPAAVKVLHEPLARSVRMIQRFAREAEAIARIDHENVVRVFEAGELHDGRPFFAMEWLPGRNLREELAIRGPLAARDAAAVVRELGAALDAAHEQGVIHRDLKAQNVIAMPRDDWFQVKIVDFGIAKLRTPDDMGMSFTSRTILGTPHTAAPEQLLGQPVDRRTDVYALGVLVYQLLTGRLPFDGANPLEVEELHLHAQPPAASASAPVPVAVDEVVRRAMAKQPEERYPTAGAVADAFAEALAGAPVASRETAVGAAVYIIADDDTDDDDLLERIDSVLARVETAAHAEGMQLAAATPSSLLAVSLADDAAARAERVRLACDIAASHDTPVRARVRTGNVSVRRRGADVELVEGDLLRPADWPET